MLRIGLFGHFLLIAYSIAFATPIPPPKMVVKLEEEKSSDQVFSIISLSHTIFNNSLHSLSLLSLFHLSYSPFAPPRRVLAPSAGVHPSINHLALEKIKIKNKLTKLDDP